MKSHHYQEVENFMLRAGQRCPLDPEEPTDEERILRAKLIFEEVMETIQDGLGIDISLIIKPGLLGEKHCDIDRNEVDFRIVQPFNMIETIDGCCDIKVVTTGTLIACGVQDIEPQREVDESNLRKFGPGGHRRDDGKWIKPTNWVAPDIAGVVGWVEEKPAISVKEHHRKPLDNSYDRYCRVCEINRVHRHSVDTVCPDCVGKTKVE